MRKVYPRKAGSARTDEGGARGKIKCRRVRRRLLGSRVFPSAEFLLPLSDALHIDVEELLSGEDLAEKTPPRPLLRPPFPSRHFMRRSTLNVRRFPKRLPMLCLIRKVHRFSKRLPTFRLIRKVRRFPKQLPTFRPIANARRRPNCPPLPYLLLLLPKLPRLPLRPPLPPQRVITKNCGRK